MHEVKGSDNQVTTAVRSAPFHWAASLEPLPAESHDSTEKFTCYAATHASRCLQYAFQRQQMSHDQLPFEGTIRPSLPCCFGVNVRFGSLWLASEGRLSYVADSSGPCMLGFWKQHAICVLPCSSVTSASPAATPRLHDSPPSTAPKRANEPRRDGSYIGALCIHKIAYFLFCRHAPFLLLPCHPKKGGRRHHGGSPTKKWIDINWIVE